MCAANQGGGKGPIRLYLASANPHKAAEFQALADTLRAEAPAGSPEVEILSAERAGGMPRVTEDAGTFAGNAAKKARALAQSLPEGSWALADDSGICVESLGGAPGVESAYFAGPQGDAAANLAKLVEAMRGAPAGRRGAEFVCTLALCGPGGLERFFEGRCRGRLAEEPRGSNGFGYDPLFVPEGFERTMAELPAQTKNRVSHRARAWLRCAGWLAASR